MTNKICEASEAVADIPDGAAVASVGVIGWVTPDKTLKAIGDRFEQTGTPRNLTFYFPCGTGDAQRIRGMDHVARAGLMKRIVSGSYINPRHPDTGERPRLMQLIHNNEIEAYSWPIGASMHWLREVARKSPGYLTTVGVGTYIDPDLRGGKFTDACSEDLVEKINFRGKPHLFYPTWPLDVGIVRATAADEFGNLSFEDEALFSSNLGIALAVKASGGTVIAQVQRVVARGERAASDVRIPGSLVDRVVVDPDQMMVTETPLDPHYLGRKRLPLDDLPRLPEGPDTIIARRASVEVRKRELSIFGFGAAANIPLAMAGDGLFANGGLSDYEFTTEHGSFGGVVMSGWQFSCNLNPEALIDGLSQFDLIDGGLCRFAALAFAEFDARGCVNVSKFGPANPGAGGFIDIAHNAERLVFTGTFTTGGLACETGDGTIAITREGKISKFVETVEDVTYDALAGVRERGQQTLIVTERGVFELTADGLVLIEVAPGIDVRTQILDLMAFAPVQVRDPLPTMPARLFLRDEKSTA